MPGAQRSRVPPAPATPDPARVLPITARVIVRYAKRGRMRFASHRDVARAIERGVRKAGVPVAYSAGFSPHPRISYSGGAPTGSASEAEYLEISLTRRWEPAHLGRLLDAALPDGIDVVDVVEVDARSAGLRLAASLWEVLLPGVTADMMRSARDAFLAAPTAVVERLTSKGKRQLDARAAVVSLEVDRHVGTDQGVGCAILRMVVRQMTPAVRPDDVLTALGQFMVLAPASPPLVTRLWQGPLDSTAADQSDAVGALEVHAVEAHAAEAQTVMAAQTGTYGVTGTAVPHSAASDSAASDSAASDSAAPQEARRLGAVPSTAVSRESVPHIPMPQAPSPAITSARPAAGSAGTQGLAGNQATRLEAGSAEPAPVVKARANEQLSRGERADLDDLRAREPNGRDCPNARNRATESTAGTK
jgi:radical SAM-linked protein